jgi:hypothetical protein
MREKARLTGGSKRPKEPIRAAIVSMRIGATKSIGKIRLTISPPAVELVSNEIMVPWGFRVTPETEINKRAREVFNAIPIAPVEEKTL